MTTFYAFGLPLRRALRAVLWLILSASLGASANAEEISFGIKLPLPYVGEIIHDGSFGSSWSLYEHEGTATATGFFADSEDYSFTLFLHLGGETKTLTYSDVINVGNGGFISPSFLPDPGFLPTLRLLLPPGFENNTLVLAQVDGNGTVFTTPISVGTYVYLDSGNGTGLSYPKVSTDYDSSYPFWVVDLTNRRKSPQGDTDLRFVTWEPDYSQYPLVPITMYLEGREVGHKFTVLSWADGGNPMYSSVTATPTTLSGSADGFCAPNWTASTFNVPPGSACLQFSVGDGMWFYVIREADGVNTPAAIGGDFVFLADSTTPLNWALFGLFPDPPLRQLQDRHFRINRARVGHEFSVIMSDGYRSRFSGINFGYDAIYQWEGQMVDNPLFLLTFTAQIDPTKTWWLRDDTTGQTFPIGQTDIFDNWTPNYNSSFYAITLRLPWWGMVGSSPELIDLGTGNSIPWSGASADSTTFPGVDGMANFTIDGTILVFPNPYPEGLDGSFEYVGGFAGGSYLVSWGVNDLRLAFEESTRNTQISDSRWFHELVLRHPNGDSFPIAKSASQGVYSFDPGGGVSPIPYYYFSAASDHYAMLPFYVEDLATQERIGPNPTNEELIQWSFTPAPSNLYMLWRFDGGVTFAWDSSGASLAGGYTVQRKILPATTWTDVATIAATSTSYTDVLPGNAAATYRVVYFYGNRISGPSNELAVAAFNPVGGSEDNGGGGTGTGSGSSPGGTPPAGQDGPQDDPDNDGLTNAEEIEAGSDCTKADTDDDGVDDGEDGWPQAKHLNTPRLPVWRYAVVELVNDDRSSPIALNNKGDVIYQKNRHAPPRPEVDLYYLAAGQTNATKIENLNFGTGYTDYGRLIGIADDGTVAGTWDRYEDVPEPGSDIFHRNFTWKPGHQSIMYSGDGCAIPPQFSNDGERGRYAYSSFVISGITPGGTLYGTGSVGASYTYTPNRTVTIQGMAVNGRLVAGYPQAVYPSANSWINEESNRTGHMTWTGESYLVNNSGELFYKYTGFSKSGEAPIGPDRPRGCYYTRSNLANGTLVNCARDCEALNDDLQMLGRDSILARTSERNSSSPTWTSYAAPRISRAKPYGKPNWIDFNNRLEAIGSRTKTESGTTLADWAVLINDHDYSIQDLVPSEWTIKDLVQINESGMILARARGATAEQDSIVFLLPFELNSDLNNDGKAGEGADSSLKTAGAEDSASEEAREKATEYLFVNDQLSNGLFDKDDTSATKPSASHTDDDDLTELKTICAATWGAIWFEYEGGDVSKLAFYKAKECTAANKVTFPFALSETNKLPENLWARAEPDSAWTDQAEGKLVMKFGKVDKSETWATDKLRFTVVKHIGHTKFFHATRDYILENNTRFWAGYKVYGTGGGAKTVRMVVMREEAAKMQALDTYWRQPALWGIDEVVGAYGGASVAINSNFTFDIQSIGFFRDITRRCHGRLVSGGVDNTNVSSDNADPNNPAPGDPLRGSVYAGPEGKYIAMPQDYSFTMSEGRVPLSPMPKEALGGWHTDYTRGNQDQMVGIGKVGDQHRMVFTATVVAGSGVTASFAADAKLSGVPALPGGDADDIMLILGDANTSIALAYKKGDDLLTVTNKGSKHTWVGAAGGYTINTYLLFYCNKPRP